MKTTVNMNHYLVKGIIIMGIALTLQGIISLHKSGFYEMNQGKAISNFSPKGNNANAFMVAMTDNNKKTIATIGSSVSTIPAVAFKEPANLEKNLIEAAGISEYKPTCESFEDNTSSDNLEEMMINAAGLNKFLVAGVDQDDAVYSDAVLEQNMTEAAGIYRVEQDNSDIFLTGDEVDYQTLEENMVKAAGIYRAEQDNSDNFSAGEEVDYQTLEENMINAAGLGYNTLPADATLEMDSLETLMISAAGIYQVSPVSE